MIDYIIAYSIRNKFLIGLAVLGIIGWGIYSLSQLPIDAVPDITNNQVQIITVSPTLAAQEVEQFISYPVELAMQNLPGVEEIRSISRFGLSVVTVVFKDKMGTYLPRQLVSEKLIEAKSEIPDGFGEPGMAPITTGLGEIYQYVLRAKEGYEEKYNAMELRTIQDWMVKRQLAGTPGLVEVNSFGGFLKQYEVGINPERLRSMNVTVSEIFEALQQNNENTGGSYIEKGPNAYFIRGEGMVNTLEDIGDIVIKTVEGIPVYIRDVARVHFGTAPRFGAMTRNGEGEVTGGMVLMLKGENTEAVIGKVKERIEQIQKTLPEGLLIEPFIDRTKFIDKTIHTVSKNLLEGGLIVIFVLVLLLGNFRAGLIVASIIPIAMLFAISLMNLFGVSANLMSLGAIDFGLVVDGAVIIVENVIFTITYKYGKLNRLLSPDERDSLTNSSASRMMRSALFGQIIILIVYFPILSLTGIEGKMFGPMAITVSFVIIGAILLCLTYVPMMAALLLRKGESEKKTISDRIMYGLHRIYTPVIKAALNHRVLTIVLAVALFGLSLFTFSNMGGEFIPKLEEGDLAVNFSIKPGSSLSQTVKTGTQLEKIILENFPEVNEVLTRVGAAEIPTDPMPIESGDLFILLKEKEEWTTADNLPELVERIKEKMSLIPGVNFEFSQPIELRFNELMTGVRSDIAIKIYGENLDVLFENANKLNGIIQGIPGVGDTKVEQIIGLPQMLIQYKRNKLAQYGLKVKELNQLVKTSFAGDATGVVFEGEKRFDLVVRLEEDFRKDIGNIENLYVNLPGGAQVPLQEVADINLKEGPLQISRDNAKRRIVVGVNVRNRDVQSVVEDMQEALSNQLKLPPGYYITYGGQFENLTKAKERLGVAVPIALLLILLMLFFAFNSMTQALLIFTAIPFSAIGGVFALYFRGMNFNISAGIGFIALFGVAVLFGILLVNYFNQLKEEGVTDVKERILKGTKIILRPLIIAAALAILGFLPMALSTSAGAEVQKPLATVVIGGLISATILTLVMLPVLYSLIAGWQTRQIQNKSLALFLFLVTASFFGNNLNAQTPALPLPDAIQLALTNHPAMQTANYQIQEQETLRRSGFDLPKTQFFYEGDALGRRTPDLQHNFGISQSIDHPRVFKSRNALQEELIKLSGSNKAVTKRALEQQVTMAYYDLLAAQNKAQLFAFLDSLYFEFNQLSALRYQTGETNLLEKVSVENQFQKIKVLETQAFLTVHQERRRLQLLLGIGEPPEIQGSVLRRIPPASVDTSFADNPLLIFYRQLQEVVKAEEKVEKAALLPDFSLSYSTQVIDGVGGFSGVGVGLGVPLYRKSQHKRIEAAKVRQMVVRSQYEEQRLQLESLLIDRLLRLQNMEEALVFYERQGQQLAAEILRSAHLNFSAGEIDYVEYTQGLKQVFDLRKGYLDNLQMYNRAMIEVNYLLSGN